MKIYDVLPVTTDYTGEIILDNDGEYFIKWNHYKLQDDMLTITCGTSSGFHSVQDLVEEFGLDNVDLMSAS